MTTASLTRPVALLRLLGIVEGISYIVLLFGAMPMKYLLDLPMAVRIVGSVHGLLFVVFAMALFRAYAERSWPLARAARVFIASLIPFGFVLIDRMLREEILAETADAEAALESAGA